MDHLLTIIPEVRRLHLLDVGPWKDAALKFTSGINIIRNVEGGRGGCGKSIILRSLLPVADKNLHGRRGSEHGTIHIEYARPGWRYTAPKSHSPGADKATSSASGERIMQALDQAINRAQTGCCLCFDDEIFGPLDAQMCAEAIAMINKAKVQFILVLPSPVNPARFDSPRVFECAYDKITNSSKVVRF
jgi:hypothetical protein